MKCAAFLGAALRGILLRPRRVSTRAVVIAIISDRDRSERETEAKSDAVDRSNPAVEITPREHVEAWGADSCA
jgi:hypothetical protein